MAGSDGLASVEEVVSLETCAAVDCSAGAGEAAAPEAAIRVNARIATDDVLYVLERRTVLINWSRRRLRRRAILSPTGLPNTRFPQILV